MLSALVFTKFGGARPSKLLGICSDAAWGREDRFYTPYNTMNALRSFAQISGLRVTRIVAFSRVLLF